MKCTTKAAEGGYCGGWDKETLKCCGLKAAVCPECDAAYDVDNVAYWLVRFEERQQRASELNGQCAQVERSVNRTDDRPVSRTDFPTSLHFLKCLLEKHANSPELIAYLLLAHQEDMLTIGCSSDGRLLLQALWLTYETEDGLRAYPLCPHMDHEAIRVDRSLGVSVAAESQEKKSNTWLMELNSIVEAMLKQLQILPPVYDGRFVGLVWAKHDRKCVFTLQQKTKENFRPVKVPEIGKVWVHKDYVADFRAVQVSYVRELKRKVLRRIANDPSIFISHTGRDSDAGSFAAHLHDKLKDQGIVSFCSSSSIQPCELWQDRIRSEVGKCGVFVAILSPTYFQRNWCMHELDLALRQGRRIFPVYYGKHGPNDIPGDEGEFISRFVEDKGVKQDEVERWWNNIRRIPEMQDKRMSSFENTQDAEVKLKNTVVEEINKLLEQ